MIMIIWAIMHLLFIGLLVQTEAGFMKLIHKILPLVTALWLLAGLITGYQLGYVTIIAGGLIITLALLTISGNKYILLYFRYIALLGGIGLILMEIL